MKNPQPFCFARQNLNNHPHTSLQNENLKYGIKVGKPKEYGCKWKYLYMSTFNIYLIIISVKVNI